MKNKYCHVKISIMFSRMCLFHFPKVENCNENRQSRPEMRRNAQNSMAIKEAITYPKESILLGLVGPHHVVGFLTDRVPLDMPASTGSFQHVTGRLLFFAHVCDTGIHGITFDQHPVTLFANGPFDCRRSKYFQTLIKTLQKKTQIQYQYLQPQDTLSGRRLHCLRI